MEYQRVTEILYPFSGLKYVDPTILENAAARGTRVHKACEAIASGLEGWELPSEFQGYIASFRSWFDRGHKIIAIEERMFCDELGITGQVDLIVEEPEENLIGDEAQGVFIVDLKTSQNEAKSWMLQGSAYSYLAKQIGYHVKGIMFLRLRRDGSPAKEHHYDENMDLFRECLNVYRYFYGRKTKKKGKEAFSKQTK